jgi:thiamine biosynthesis protein ThiI
MPCELPLKHWSDVLVHYGEIAIKGKNRPAFVGLLERNLRRALAGLPLEKIAHPAGRLWLRAKSGESLGEEALVRLRHVFGVSSFSPATRTTLDLDAIKELAFAMVRERSYQSFRVSARRAYKSLPYPSQDVNREVGAYLFDRKPAKVQMVGAEMEVFIEMVPGAAYVYVDKLRGLGGLPVGMSGTVGCLLSGGIDSPVAALRLLRRGCRLVLIHFSGQPIQSKASVEKATDLAELLARFQTEITLYVVPFGALQSQIVTACPERLRVVLYRRFMLRIAAELAARDGAQALVTGESLGQVASQTLTNLIAIDAASPLPVLRPLIGFDKQEIVDQAKQLGSFSISIAPDEDCCSLFVPKHPETKARPVEVEAAEKALDVSGMCEAALMHVERLHLHAPWWTPRKKVTPFQMNVSSRAS